MYILSVEEQFLSVHDSTILKNKRKAPMGLTLIRAAGGVYDFRNFKQV